MKVRQIKHRNGSYDVSFVTVQEAIQRLPADARLVTDANVFDSYSSYLSDRDFVQVIQPGEHSKSLIQVGLLLSWLAQTKASRSTPVCALGGGVIGDLVGFVAATYMRGVPFIQVPTTLLAQVDSSVGGKVGIDLPEGKNLAGAFYPPVAVSIATEALSTLPVRQFNNGMAEVWKYGFIVDEELVGVLDRNNLNVTHKSMPSIVEWCISLKARIVEEDEFELLGRRAILNFGHTVGHAIEVLTGYNSVLHGEAISIGMVVETRIGELLGITRHGAALEIEQRMVRQGLPVTHEVLQNPSELLQAMYGDKKVTNGRLAFSLLNDIGHCRLVEGVDESAVLSALRYS